MPPPAPTTSEDWTYDPDLLLGALPKPGMVPPPDPKAVVSADGRWLAYVSNYSGIDEIFVTAFPVPGARYKISMKGGHSPTWAPDGKTLYYFQNSRMIAVTIDTEPAFHVTGRDELFEGLEIAEDPTPERSSFMVLELDFSAVVLLWVAAFLPSRAPGHGPRVRCIPKHVRLTFPQA